MPLMTITSCLMAFFLAILGAPLAVALALSCSVALLVFRPIPSFELIPQMMTIVTETFVLTAVPLFILAGVMMEKGGLGERLVALGNAVVGWTRGGLGAANIVGSMIFGGCSGSSLADTAALGSLLIPRMVEEGYDRDYSGAVTATSSTLAVVIPPSILLIVWGVVAEKSVARLLIGGVIPGILITILLLIVNFFISRKRNYGSYVKLTRSGLTEGLRVGIGPLLAPAVILGGIMTGIFTPTEAAAVASFYAFFLSALIYKQMRLEQYFQVLVQAAKITAAIMFIVAASRLFTWIITWEDVPKLIINHILGITRNPKLILLIINLILIGVGMILDVVVAVIVFTPLFLPVVNTVGIDPIHFGVVMVGNLAIGLVTPPFGVCLYSVSVVGKIPLERIVKESIPFYMSLIAALLLYTYIPSLVLFLPNLMFGK